MFHAIDLHLCVFFFGEQLCVSSATPLFAFPLFFLTVRNNFLLCYPLWPYLVGYSTGYNSGSMHGIFAGTRGPFTPSQWMELEHQALIYKYLTANVPVPSHLLIPIKKALESAGFCNFSSGLLRPNASKFLYSCPNNKSWSLLYSQRWRECLVFNSKCMFESINTVNRNSITTLDSNVLLSSSSWKLNFQNFLLLKWIQWI